MDSVLKIHKSDFRRIPLLKPHIISQYENRFEYLSKKITGIQSPYVDVFRDPSADLQEPQAEGIFLGVSVLRNVIVGIQGADDMVHRTGVKVELGAQFGELQTLGMFAERLDDANAAFDRVEPYSL